MSTAVLLVHRWGESPTPSEVAVAVAAEELEGRTPGLSWPHGCVPELHALVWLSLAHVSVEHILCLRSPVQGHLAGSRLFGRVDDAAWTWCSRVPASPRLGALAETPGWLAGPLVIPSDFEELPGCFMQPQRSCLVLFGEKAVPETCSYPGLHPLPQMALHLDRSTGPSPGGAGGGQLGRWAVSRAARRRVEAWRGRSCPEGRVGQET